jgi:molybdopterin molybdotransferase
MTSPPPPIPLAHAWERLLGSVEPLASETISVDQAVGRYLAHDVLAARTQPAADLSAMDGYAVRGDDDTGPWTIIGESAAGHPFLGEVGPAQAVRISTGALMPAGAAMVLLQENAVRDGNALSLIAGSKPSPGHIRRTGFDFREGDALLRAGSKVGPPQLAVALSGGHASLAVHRLPSLAVLDSGDELATDPAACAPHQIPASNGSMLAAMAMPITSSITRLGPVPDTRDALARALAMADDVEVLVTSGGASVGDHDLVRPALEAWGAQIDFWRVALKPGKPLMVARRGRQWILGLPGNPVSSYVTAFLFLLPLLRALAGAAAESILPRAHQARLGEPLPATGDRREFVRGRFSDQTQMLSPVWEQDSSALNALAAANALIDRGPGLPALDAGQHAFFYLLENGGMG